MHTRFQVIVMRRIWDDNRDEGLYDSLGPLGNMDTCSIGELGAIIRIEYTGKQNIQYFRASGVISSIERQNMCVWYLYQLGDLGSLFIF